MLIFHLVSRIRNIVYRMYIKILNNASGFLSEYFFTAFFQAAIVSLPLYGFTTWILTKHIEKRLNSNCTRILQANSANNIPHNTSCMATSPISKTIHTKHTGHCWRSKDDHISYSWSSNTYPQQFCMDIGCSKEDPPNVMDVRDKWCERERESGKSRLVAQYEDDNQSIALNC